MRYDRNQFVPTPVTATPARRCRRTARCPIRSSASTSSRTIIAKLADQNQIGRTEDFYFGTEVSGQLGWSSTAFGADRDGVMLAAKARKGFTARA